MSMIIEHNITIDLTQPGATPRIQIKQGDVISRRVTLHLYTDGEAWTVPEDAEVMIRFHVHDLDGGEDFEGIYDSLPDGTAAWSISENTISFIPIDTMTARHGIVAADVVLLEETRILSTFNFEFYVNRAPVAETETNFPDYYNVMSLRQIDDQITSLDERVTTLEENHITLLRRVNIMAQDVENLSKIVAGLVK